jgi:hypothetical protein
MKKIILSLIAISLLTSTDMNAQNEDFRKMIEFAIKAPSGHNTQPWKYRIGSDRIEIIPDFSKTLPVVDADNRELFISLGCAVENLCISASNLYYQSDMQIAEDGTITVLLTKSEAVIPDTLISQISVRQTNRNVYDYKIIDDKVLEKCLQVLSSQKDIKLHYWENGTAQFDSLSNFVLRGNILQMDNKDFTDELKSWMRYNKKDSESKQDGLAYDVFGAPNLPKFISKPAISSFLNSNKQNKSDKKKIESSSHFVLFTTTNNQLADWIKLGRFMQRFLLITTQENIAHAYMNQPCEVIELREELRQKLPINNAFPQILLRIGYGKKAPYSKRKSIDEVIID